MPGKIEDLSGLTHFKKVTTAPNRLCTIHFHAPWATQCKSMDEAMQILAGEDSYKEVTFARVEAEEEAEISMEYEVAAVPTLLFMEGAYTMLARN
jgi:thioredoxin-like negative regulator of GroEL